MSIRRTLARVLVLSAGLTGALRLVAHADAAMAKHHGPPPPKELSAPDGQRLAFQLHGDGVQIYACQSGEVAAAWVLSGPEAKLFDARGHEAGKHYAGPTWEGSDGSTVVGIKLRAYSAAPTDVPWLLLQAASHTGHGVMSNVSYVQRLDTKGGVAPAIGCDASHLGESVRVAYSASYVFFEPKADSHAK